MQPPQHSIRRLSVTTGVALGVAGTILGFIILLLPPYFNLPILTLFLLLASFGLLTYFSHCLAHFIVGKIIGLKFSYYVFGASPKSQTNSQVIGKLDVLLPRLGIRLTQQSRKNATHRQRVLLFSSGVVSSTLLPLIPVTTGYLTLPSPLNVLLALLWIAYLIFGVYFSPRFGDLSRIKTTI
jgi:uncharacterized membrane protein